MKQNILFINDRLHSGGVEMILQSLCACLAEKGCKLSIWAPEGDRETLKEKYPPGVKYRRLPFWYGLSKRFSPKWFYQRGCRVLFEGFLLKAKKWDTVIAFKEGPSMRLASRLRAEKKLAWIHTDFSSLHWSRHEFHSDDEELACMRRFDKVVCVSQAGADSLVRTLGDPGNLCVRHNPINYQAIMASAALVPSDCVRPEGKPLFVSVGRLSEIKRYDMLIDICAALEKRYAFEMWIVGGGEQEAELRQKLRIEGVKSVKLLGRRDNPYPYMAAADWFISSSASECHPLAVQEAMVLGLPVLASYCPAMAETLDSRLSRICGGDRAALEGAMEELLADPSLSEKYRENIRRRYDKSGLWEARLEDICSLLENE